MEYRHTIDFSRTAPYSAYFKQIDLKYVLRNHTADAPYVPARRAVIPDNCVAVGFCRLPKTARFPKNQPNTRNPPTIKRMTPEEYWGKGNLYDKG